VVGRTSATDVSRLIEEVARGERELSEIRDEKLREIVRLALRLHKDPFSAPDAAARNRIRRRVMGSLRPHRPSLADRFVIAFTLLAKPTPYALRAIAVALVVVSLAGGTLVASADALPDDALYPVKIATEQVRLALATTSQDRAVVELSIAEHRLAEATVLAEDGDDDDAVIATSAYSEHLANAAAELAGSEAVDPRTADLVSQLQDRMNEHRAAAAKAGAVRPQPGRSDRRRRGEHRRRRRERRGKEDRAAAHRESSFRVGAPRRLGALAGGDAGASGRDPERPRVGGLPGHAGVVAAVADGRPAGGSRRRRRAEGRRRGEGRRAKGEGRRQQEERRR